MRRIAFLLTWLAVASAVDAQEGRPPPAVGVAGPARTAAAPDRKFSTMDRLELESTSITGNRELPKVMYVVPWKRADLGDLGGKPLRSLVDEALTPVDREVFGREIGYFHALGTDSTVNAETPVTAGERAP